MTEWVEQTICITFCVKLKHPPQKLSGWFRKLQLQATGDWQLHHDNTPARASCLMQSFLTKHQITQMTQLCFSPDMAPWQLLAFAKTRITFEREEISNHWWDSGKYDGAAVGEWEKCVRSQGAYFEGDWGIIVLCTMFLVSSSINIYFSYYTAGYFLNRPHIYIHNYSEK